MQLSSLKEFTLIIYKYLHVSIYWPSLSITRRTNEITCLFLFCSKYFLFAILCSHYNILHSHLFTPCIPLDTFSSLLILHNSLHLFRSTTDSCCLISVYSFPFSIHLFSKFIQSLLLPLSFLFSRSSVLRNSILHCHLWPKLSFLSLLTLHLELWPHFYSTLSSPVISTCAPCTPFLFFVNFYFSFCIFYVLFY